MFSKVRQATYISMMLRLIISISLLTCHALSYDVLVLGDSISSGYGVLPSESWVKIWAEKLPCSPRLLNLSIQGATTNDGLQSLKHFYKENQSKWVIVELGGNDGLRGLKLSLMEARLSSIIELALSSEASVILLATDLPPNYGQLYRRQYRSTFERLAESYHLPLVKLAFPEDEALMQDDGIHPNAQGHEKIAIEMLTMKTFVCSAH